MEKIENRNDAVSIINRLRNQGIKLWSENEKIKYEAPKGTLTEEIKNNIRMNRSIILDILNEEKEYNFSNYMHESNIDSFPLTDVQSSYYLGRSDAVLWGGVNGRGYVEVNFESKSFNEINNGWNMLVNRHEMLRAYIENGKIKINENKYYNTMECYDLRNLGLEEIDCKLKDIREEFQYNCDNSNEKVPFNTCITLRNEGTFLHLMVDLIACDFGSIQILIGELGKILKGISLPDINIKFTQYLLFLQDMKKHLKWQNDKNYWLNKNIYNSPSLPIDGRAKANEVNRIEFYRLQKKVSNYKWDKIKKISRMYGLTSSSVILTVYAEILNRWSENSKFTINLPLQNRLPVHEEVCKLVGDFTSVTLLSMDLSEKVQFYKRAEQLSRQLIEDIDHKTFSGVDLIREIIKEKGRKAGLMPYVFTGVLKAEQNSGVIDYGISQTPQVWIDCQAVDQSELKEGNGLLVSWDVRRGVIKDYIIEEAFNAFIETFESLADSSEIWEKPIELKIKSKEIETEWLDLDKSLLYENFIENAIKKPFNIAVIDSKNEVTYGQLLEESLKVANYLLKNTKNTIDSNFVGVKLHRGYKQVVSVLGVLLAGFTYIPINVAQPEKRLKYIIKETNMQLILTDSLVEEIITNSNKVSIDIINKYINPNSLAYVIYTSGSTGEPKGVKISHKAAMTTIQAVIEMLKITEEDSIISVADLSFDLSVFDIFGLLNVGGRVILLDDENLINPNYWRDIIDKYNVTLWNSVPAHMELLLSSCDENDRFNSIKSLWMSGDYIKPTILNKIKVSFPNAELYSFGGATEASIWSNYHKIEDISKETPTVIYGRPLKGQSESVINENGDVCPTYVIGEIVIGGEALSTGYVNSEELTNEKFIYDVNTKKRIYKTGDKGRFLENSEIEILGRTDEQIKVNGHRIELTEIETAISSIPQIKDCAAIKYNNKIVAFIKKKDSDFNIPLSIKKKDKILSNNIEKNRIKYFDQILEKSILETIICNLVDNKVISKEWKDIDEIILSSGIDNKYKEILEECFKYLCNNNFMDKKESYYKVDIENIREYDSYWKRLSGDKNINFASDNVSKYIRYHCEHFYELLTGKFNALSILFPQGKMDIAKSLYSETVISNYLNNLVAEILESYIKYRNKKVSILEVGAGTGATTDVIYNNIEQDKFNYLFTDISNFFLNNIQKKYSNINTKILDLNNINEEKKYDVLIAAGSLNTVKNISNTVKKLNDILEEDGILLITEPTKEHLEIWVSQALLMPEQDDKRKEDKKCFFNIEDWKELFNKLNLKMVDIFPNKDSNYYEFGQSLMVLYKKRKNVNKLYNLSDEEKKFLSYQLQDYMIPEYFIETTDIGLNNNGKVNKKKLEEIFSDILVNFNESKLERKEVIDNSILENKIISIFQSVLNKKIELKERSLLELGFDSLLLAQATGKVIKEIDEAKDIKFDQLLRELLEKPSIESITKYICNNGILGKEDVFENIKDGGKCEYKNIVFSFLSNKYEKVEKNIKLDNKYLFITDINELKNREYIKDDMRIIVISDGERCNEAIEFSSDLLAKGKEIDDLILIKPNKLDKKNIFLGNVQVFSNIDINKQDIEEIVLGDIIYKLSDKNIEEAVLDYIQRDGR